MSQYVRVYYSIVDDERFASIYQTPHLATWLRLLMIADAIWPASAHLPATERRSSVEALVKCGLIELLPAGRYRVHGLDSERGRRSESSAVGGRARQRSVSERSANAQRTVSLAEQSRDEPSKAEQSTACDRADVEAFLATRYRLPTPAQQTLMDAYLRVFDLTGPERAARLIYSHPDDPIGALKADLDAFRKERAADAESQDHPKPKRRDKGSGMTSVNQELARIMPSLVPREPESDPVPLRDLIGDFSAIVGGKAS